MAVVVGGRGGVVVGRGSGGGLGVCMLHLEIHINVPIYKKKKEIILSRSQGGAGW